jgi:hypothetical protein
MKNPRMAGNLSILLQCTIVVFEWLPVGIRAYGQAVPEQAAGALRDRPKSLFWLAACSIP